MYMIERKLIFISHATPEDNSFCLWLSIRLKLLGYEVWSDITKLFGGEKWWHDIDEAIDLSTCKFLLIISQKSLPKPGVRREVELALKAEEKYKLRNFVIPLLIDETSFTGLPFDLSERNIISFSTGWGTAYARLVERLSRDGVPRADHNGDLATQISLLSNPSHLVSEEKDVALSNWLAIKSTPPYLYFYRLPSDQASWRTWLSAWKRPWFEWSGMLVTFAAIEDLKVQLPSYIVPTQAGKLELAAVLENRQRSYPEFSRSEIFKQINFLVLEGFKEFLKSRGLCIYELTSGRLAWFFPNTPLHSGKQEFQDIDGRFRRKQILGFSAFNSVFWHYAVEVKVFYGQSPRICLIPHVAFSEDGLTPLADKDKMHSLRRGFCRNWWNDKWRDLLLLFLDLVSKRQPLVYALTGGNDVHISSRPITFSANFKLKSQDDMETRTPDVEDISVDPETSEEFDDE